MSDADTDMHKKDTVLSTLVLCGVHAREGSCHATEKLEGKRTSFILSDKEYTLLGKMKSAQHVVYNPNN